MNETCDNCKRVLDDEEPRVFFYNGPNRPEKVWCKPCYRTDQIKVYTDTKRISSSLAVDVQIAEAVSDPRLRVPKPMPDSLKPIQKDLERIYTAIVEFSKHWSKIIEFSDAETKLKGLSYTLDSETKVMTWTMCGRIMLTVDSKDNSITVMGNDHVSEEDEQNGCCFRGIDATADGAIALLKKVTRAAETGTLDLKADKNVSYCGM